MFLGKNLQYLRKMHGAMTQEKLAEELDVSRQTISKWESGEATPEMEKLFLLADRFGCKLDSLLRTDMSTPEDDIYSPVRFETVKPFMMARYLMISPNPEDDVNRYMEDWARKNGLCEGGAKPKMIGWDFPHVSQEQSARFGLHGYVAAVILPEGFDTSRTGADYGMQEEAVYAVVTVKEPFFAPFERIPQAYKRIMRRLDANGFREKARENVLACFESVREQDGVEYMDVYVHADGVAKANLFTNYSFTRT